MLSFKKGRKTRLFTLSTLLFSMVFFFQNCSKLTGKQVDLTDRLSSSQSFSSLVGKGPGAAPLRRISNLEYLNSIKDATLYQFTKQNSPGSGTFAPWENGIWNAFSTMPFDNATLRLGTNETASTLSESRLSSYITIADIVSKRNTADSGRLKAFVGACAVDNTTFNNALCIDNFIKSFGLTLFRGPVRPAEILELKNGATTWQQLIGRMYLHPRFIMQIHRDGVPIEAGSDVYQLTDYELAAKLASVFWKSIPDPQGLAAAASGALKTPEGLRAEITRIVNSPKTKIVMTEFYTQWLAFKRLSRYPSGDLIRKYLLPLDEKLDGIDGIEVAALKDGQDFLNYVTWQSNGTLEDIFRSPAIMTTHPGLAKIYGTTARADDSQPPRMDATGNYKGILSRAAITQQKASNNGDTNIIQRGVLLSTNILGFSLGMPANFNEQETQALNIPASSSVRFETFQKTKPANCMACHSIINPAGYSLGNYDSIGRYITTERRPYYDYSANAWKEYLNPVDSSTTLFINGQTYNINNLEDFVNAIFTSGRIYEAFSNYYFKFSFGRAESAEFDRPLLESFRSNLKTKSIKQSLIEMAMHEHFSKTREAR